MQIILLLIALFSHTNDECNLCSWPKIGYANQRGQCVTAIGFQANLDNTCHNYCLLWATDVNTVTGYVLIKPSESVSGSQCVCKRQTSTGPLEYITRPSNSCPADWMGPTDGEIDSWKNTSQNSANAYNTDKMNSLMTVGVPWMGAGDQLVTVSQMTGHFSPTDNTLFINGGSLFMPAFHDKIAGSIMSATFLGMKHTSVVGARHDSILANIGDTLATVLAVARRAATGDDLKKLGEDLKYSINTRMGSSGGTTTDLSGVLSAIADGTSSTNAALARVQATLDDQAANTDLTGTNTRIDGLKAQTITNTKNQIDNDNANYKDAKDEDAKAADDLKAYKAGMAGATPAEIAAAASGAGASADAKAAEITSAKEGLLSSLDGWKTLSTTCSDGIISGATVEFTIQGFHWKSDFDELLNSSVPQKFLYLMRLVMRAIGAIGAVLASMSISKMLSGIGSSAKQSNPFYWEI